MVCYTYMLQLASRRMTDRLRRLFPMLYVLRSSPTHTTYGLRAR